MSVEMNDYRPGGAPWTGRRMLITMLLFFGVIIAVNMTMLYLALTNFTGLVVKNSYVAGLTFEENRAKNKSALIAKWAVKAHLGEATVKLTLKDAAGAPVAGRALMGVIGRPSHERADAAVSFRETAPGVYVASRPVGDGAWLLTLADGADAETARRFELYRAPVGGAATSKKD